MAEEDTILQHGFELTCKKNAGLDAVYDKKIAEEYALLQERNVKLEIENAKLKNLCANYEMKISKMEKGTCDVCKEAEKDKRLEDLKSIADFQTSSNMDRYFQLKRSKEKLTKAEEIIKKLVNGIRILDDPKVELTDCDGFLAEAEQFLKEVSE